MSKQTVIKGTLILTITGILTKCLGFYNRIFLTRLIGVKELGTYQLIFPLYILGISFCCQGIATTITKHVSYLLGKKKMSDPRRILYFGGFLSFMLSLLVSACFFFGCDFIALHILKNTDCCILLRLLSPAVPFVAIKACINAFFIGHEKPIFSGSCQLIEQIIRIGSVYLLAISYMQNHVDAKTAVLGVVIGEMGATLYAVICYIFFRQKQRQDVRPQIRNTCTCAEKKSSLMIPMLKDIIPITSNNLVFTLFSSFEAIILPTFLFRYYNSADMTMEMYGIITGIVIPFLLFPATITNSLSTMLLPSISYACAKRDTEAIKKALVSSALFCIMLGSFACILYILFGKPICTFAFKSATAGTLLQLMGFLCPFIYLSTTLSSVMNGIGYATQNLIYSSCRISASMHTYAACSAATCFILYSQPQSLHPLTRNLFRPVVRGALVYVIIEPVGIECICMTSP